MAKIVSLYSVDEKRKAISLFAEGKSFVEIARVLNGRSRGSVGHIVRAMLRQGIRTPEDVPASTRPAGKTRTKLGERMFAARLDHDDESYRTSLKKSSARHLEDLRTHHQPGVGELNITADGHATACHNMPESTRSLTGSHGAMCAGIAG